MDVDRGDVWWGVAPYKDTPAYRPWLVVSSDAIPFAENESIVTALTTSDRDAKVAVPGSAWVAGGSEVQPYVSPWFVATFKHRSFDRRQGRIQSQFVNRIADELHRYVPGSRG